MTKEIGKPRVGRFFAVDPLASSYPWNSPYAFAENKLGLGRELEGLELGPIFLPSSTPLLGISDVVILESSVGRGGTIVRPIIEQVVKTGIEKPKGGGSWWEVLRYGSRVHKEQQGEWLKQAWNIEKWLGRINGRGNRADGFKIEKLANGEKLGIIRELKPNSTWGRQAGISQLARYLEAAQKQFPEIMQWQQELHLYEGPLAMAGLFYNVKEGDNLTDIAKKFDTTVDNLTVLNNIEDKNKIKVGETILVDFSIKKEETKKEETKKEDKPKCNFELLYQSTIK